MLVEICKGLWLIPYEIVEVSLEKGDSSEFTIVKIEYRTSPSLFTTKRRDMETNDAAVAEAKRVAELVNKFYEPSQPSSDEPLKYENYVCMRCSESKSFGDYPPDVFLLGGDGILRGKENELICYACKKEVEDEMS